MKSPFFKSLLVLGSAFALMNCGDDSTDNNPADVAENPAGPSVPSNPDLPNVPVDMNIPDEVCGETCWILKADQPYVIGSNMLVYNSDMLPIGIFDLDAKTISTADGIVILDNINPADLIIHEGKAPADKPIDVTPESSSSEVDIPASSSSSEEEVKPAESSSSSEKVVESSSSMVPTTITDGKVTISGPLTQTVAQNAMTTEIKVTGLSNEPTRLSWNAYFLETSYSNGTYTIKAATVPEYFEKGETSEFFKFEGKDYEVVLNVTDKSGSAPKSSSSQAKSSSSSQAKSSSSSQQQQQQSSSSQARSSSSSQQQQQSSSSQVTGGTSSGIASSISYTYKNTAPVEAIKPISGGRSGSGFASRYWDCCKPSCAWPGKGGLKASACSVSGSKLSDDGATSTCNGGNAGTCVSQIPMIASETLAYAYAAVPAKDGGQCGKCFALEFTGKGKYETKANHKALAGKTLIVMASNIGEDVAQGQFDVMIPGGGVGIFNGCSAYGWGNMGAQYGGLLTECEKEAGTAGNVASKRKECLMKKCESTFSKDATAKEGCMFLAVWLEAAGNPTHTYKEVECPSALKNKY